jgi:TldD protein
MDHLKALMEAYEKLDLTGLSCPYADCRIEWEAQTLVGGKNGERDSFTPVSTLGAFLRVYNRGQWFTRATTDLGSLREQLELLARDSLEGGGKESDGDLFHHQPKGEFSSLRFWEGAAPRIALAEKVALLENYLPLFKDWKEVKESSIHYSDRYQRRAFRSSRGRSFLYDFGDFGLGMRLKFRENNHFFQDVFRVWSADFSSLKNRHREAEAHFKESLAHLRAPSVTPGAYSVVMNSEVVGVFTHESFGHKSEADFMLGDEKARQEWKLGDLVAAPCVSIVDEGIGSDHSGYVPVDDEGIPATKTYLIKEGRLAGRLHSLQTAKEFAEEPTGNARAISFEYEPIVRMRNTYIEPGTLSEEQLLSQVKEGIYVTDYLHGSGLSTFTIAPIRAYRIREGKITEPVKVAVLSGSVFETLKNVRAVSNKLGIHSSVFGGCGKDEQWPLRVADGGPLMLVEGMQVG